MASEKQYEEKIKKYLSESPNTWFFKVWGGGFQKAGIPDIIACVNGNFLAIEVKAENGKASALQLRNVKLINAAKGYAVISKPSQWDELRGIIDGLNQR